MNESDIDREEFMMLRNKFPAYNFKMVRIEDFSFNDLDKGEFAISSISRKYFYVLTPIFNGAIDE